MRFLVLFVAAAITSCCGPGIHATEAAAISSCCLPGCDSVRTQLTRASITQSVVMTSCWRSDSWTTRLKVVAPYVPFWHWRFHIVYNYDHLRTDWGKSYSELLERTQCGNKYKRYDRRVRSILWRRWIEYYRKVKAVEEVNALAENFEHTRREAREYLNAGFAKCWVRLSWGYYSG